MNVAGIDVETCGHLLKMIQKDLDIYTYINIFT